MDRVIIEYISDNIEYGDNNDILFCGVNCHHYEFMNHLIKVFDLDEDLIEAYIRYVMSNASFDYIQFKEGFYFGAFIHKTEVPSSSMYEQRYVSGIDCATEGGDITTFRLINMDGLIYQNLID